MSRKFLTTPALPMLPSPPSSFIAGDLYYDTTQNLLGIYTGTAWSYAISGVADNSVTDSKIGTRQINQSYLSSTDTDTLNNLLNSLANRIAAITGSASWRNTPATTISELNTNAARKNINEVINGDWIFANTLRVNGDTQVANLTASRTTISRSDATGSGERLLEFRTDSNVRQWGIGLRGISGAGNTGHNFFIWSHDNSGNFLREVLSIQRSTGAIQMLNAERLLHVSVDQGNDNTTRYYYLGRISNQQGIFKLQGILGGHNIFEGRANIDLQFAFRDGIRVDGYIMGTVGNADILVRDGGDSWAYIYLITDRWALVNLEISKQGDAQIRYDGTFTTTAPSGTTIYQLSNDFTSNSHPNVLKLNNGVLYTNLADGSITTSKLADLAVTTAKLADLSVTTSKLADLSVTGSKLADGSVTDPKISGRLSVSKLPTSSNTGRFLVVRTANADPVYDSVQVSDLPAHTHALSNITSGTISLAGNITGSTTLTGSSTVTINTVIGTGVVAAANLAAGASGLNLGVGSLSFGAIAWNSLTWTYGYYTVTAGGTGGSGTAPPTAENNGILQVQYSTGSNIVQTYIPRGTSTGDLAIYIRVYNTSTSTWEAWRQFSNPSLSVSLTTLSFTLTSNITLSTSNSWVTIGSLNLSSGTWFVTCTATFWRTTTGARNYWTRLINLTNSTVYSGSQVFVPSNNPSGAPITYSSFVPGGITLTFQGATSVGSTSATILASTTLGSAPATFMTAIKVA